MAEALAVYSLDKEALIKEIKGELLESAVTKIRLEDYNIQQLRSLLLDIYS